MCLMGLPRSTALLGDRSFAVDRLRVFNLYVWWANYARFRRLLKVHLFDGGCGDLATLLLLRAKDVM